MVSVPPDYESRIVERLVLCYKNDANGKFFWLKESRWIAISGQNRQKKSAKIDKLDDFIAIERTIMGLINRDLIGDFQAILITWVDYLTFLHIQNQQYQIFKKSSSVLERIILKYFPRPPWFFSRHIKGTVTSWIKRRKLSGYSNSLHSFFLPS
jgi:hypothetical protein